MKKKKPELVVCKYCNAKTGNVDGVCSNCRMKKQLMKGWHWLYQGKEILTKENKGNENRQSIRGIK
jgi:hypothetical protein